mgnify:CR=1 FL=1
MTDGVADKTGRLQPGKSHVYNVLCVFVADGRLLRGVFGGFSKSSFRDDK